MDYIDKVYYINLDKRQDRNIQILQELFKFGINKDKIIRVSATEHMYGAIGCGASHIRVLKHALDKGYKNIIVLEDDFEFCVSQEIFHNNLKYFLENYPEYKICCLSYNMIKGIHLNDTLIEAINAQTTSGYLINHTFYQDVINVFQEGIDGLAKGFHPSTHAIDMIWQRKLQGPGKKFYLMKPKIGKQRSSFSDIEHRFCDYNC